MEGPLGRGAHFSLGEAAPLAPIEPPLKTCQSKMKIEGNKQKNV